MLWFSLGNYRRVVLVGVVRIIGEVIRETDAVLWKLIGEADAQLKWRLV